MRRGDRSKRLLVLGLWVSLGAHALVGMGFVRYSSVLLPAPDHRANPPDRSAERPPTRQEPEKPREIKLGIKESRADTLTWLGYQEPTEHQAKRGMTEQSAMAIAAPGPERPVEASASPPNPRPAPPAPAPSEAARQRAQALASALAMARQRLADVAQDVAQELSQKQAQVAAVDPRPTQEVPKPENPAKQAAPAADGGAGGTPGEKANKESMAVSVKDAPAVKPGKVVAAQGLEIRTVEPRYSTTTLMTRRPRNPTVLITFWRDGTVKEVQWARQGGRVYDAGSSDVNQPLLTALYAWTASGKPLEDLDPKDPEASLTIMLTVILVG